MSFVREGSGGEKRIEHSTPMPEGIREEMPGEGWGDVVEGRNNDYGEESEEWSPFVGKNVQLLNHEATTPHVKKTRRWMRCRGKISPAGGHAAHLSALAYMSDSYFIGTVASIHDLSRNGTATEAGKPAISMMVSLDHTIFFHEPRAFRADEWMFTECESPWAGDGRGVVMQKMWGSDGRLVATCFQEGLVRLRQDGGEAGSKL